MIEIPIMTFPNSSTSFTDSKMDSSITANSLAELTDLAANPPIDPRNSSIRAPSDQLILYIARVPGSKDIFLSPIRPREKTVTAEDVNSCLYYLHATGTRHDSIISSQSIPEGRAIDAPPIPPVHRSQVNLRPRGRSEKRHSLPYVKPPLPVENGYGPSSFGQPLGSNGLPKPVNRYQENRLPQRPYASQPSLDQSPPNQRSFHRPASYISSPARQSTYPPPERLQLFQDRVQINSTPNRQQSYPPPERQQPFSPPQQKLLPNGLPVKIKRKPVGQPPKPLSIQSNVANGYNVNAGEYQRRKRMSYPQSPNSPPYPIHDVFPNAEDFRPKRHLPPSPMSPGSDFTKMYTSTDSLSVKPLQSPPPSSTIVTGLTLIRRDVANGQQWNVASLVNTSSSSFGHPIPIDITINSPGYSKFVGGANIDSVTFLDPFSSGPKMSNGQVFRRELYIGGSNSGENRAEHQRAKSYDARYSIDPLRSQSSVDLNGSTYLNPRSSAPTLDQNGSHLSLNTLAKRDKKLTGHYFLSPWNGRCEFSTTVGNALKCKHILGPTVLSNQTSPPTEISELRFNLPPALTVPQSTHPTPHQQPNPYNPPDSPSRQAQETASPKRSRFFSRLKARITSWDRKLSGNNPKLENGPIVAAATAPIATVPMPSTIDLSLAQEKAGGGQSGKQAKMGKLIVRGEGLYMLDLVVAANLSLWWKAYEKEFV